MRNETLTPVDPVKPVAPYLGGKNRLAKRLVAMIAATPHTGYAEPFVGMGGIFLRRTARPRVEVINDRNGEVANLFRILQRHYPQFLDVLRFQLTTRRDFDRLIATDPATQTDLERAARFLYLQRTAFGGKISGRNFGVSNDRPARFNLTDIEPMLADVHERLASVVIECLDWLEFIDRYDHAGMLFYLDPPYFGGENDYGRGLFDRSQYARMAERLGRIKGRFILSINDRPEIREAFAGFRRDEVELSYSISSTGRTAASELIIYGGG